ncbi:MAG: WG repeat-containing protein [Bacteroidales bacterium]|nr:WG repeat-containing protein [Bacteroidales bacterium]
MKHIETILCAFAMLLSLAASAQDMKPVKDKATKKYGYQAKGKVWIIEPQFDAAGKFDKNGMAEVKLNGRTGIIDGQGTFIIPAEYDNISKFDKYGYCELMQKEGSVKYRGIADITGRIVLPLEFRDVAVSRDGRLFFGEKEAPVAGFGYERLWGIYNAAGQEIFAPQFYIRPSFNDGYAIATDGMKRLKGIICENGSVPVPFEYLAITRSSGSYKCLATDFTHVFFSGDLSSKQVFRQAGAVIPYDPQGDPVRAAAYRCGPVGVRFHENSLKLMELRRDLLGATVLCADLPIEWGYGRFVRFEPFAVQPGTTGSMSFSNQKSYVLKALLYEADGSLVKTISNYGYFEAECAQGLIYVAADGQRWLAMADINAPGMRAYTLPLVGYHELVHTDVFHGLGIDPNFVSKLSNHTDFVNRCMDIIEGENTGITSYIPLVQDGALAHAERDASRSKVFHRPFHMGEVVNCSVKRSDAGAEVKLHDELVCHFIDKFDDPYYKMEGEEIIYWGPNNARTVGLSLIASSRGGTKDDVHGTGLAYDLVLSLYEEDGRWMRTLAIMPFADYVGNGMIVFEGPGIALLTRDPFDPRFEGLDKAGSGSGSGSGSEAASGSAAGSGRTTPAPQGHSQPSQHGRQPATTTPAGPTSRAEQAKLAQEQKAEQERKAAEEKKAAEQAVRDRERRIVRLPGEHIPHTLSALEAVR